MPKITVQVIQDLTHIHSHPSIVLTINEQRYIFNTPDNYQRIQSYHQLQSKNAIFFYSQLDTSHFGGFYGLIQTMFAQKNSLNTKIYGPTGIVQLLKQLKFSQVVGYCLSPVSVCDLLFDNDLLFDKAQSNVLLGTSQIMMKDKKMNKEEYFQFFDEMMSEEHKVDEKSLNNAQQYMDYENKQFKDKNIIVKPVKTIVKDSEILSFICLTYQQQGKVLNDKLNELGILREKRKLLFEQGFIITDDGKRIEESEVRDNPIPGQSFIILDIHHKSQINQITQNIIFKQYFAKNIDKDQIEIKCIFHLCSQEVLNDQVYQDFIAQFGNIDNIVCNGQMSNKNHNLNEQQLQYLRRNQEHHAFISNLCYKLNGKFLPSNIHSSVTKHNQFEPDNLNNDISLFTKFYSNLDMMKNLFNYSLYPILKQSYQLKPDIPIISKDQNDEKIVQINTLDMQFSDDNPQIIFLGTGSMCPGKLRNVSAILVNFEQISVLMDCGEGTLNQLADRYQNEKLVEILKRIKVIIITHQHSDHHLGILKLLQIRKQYCQDYIFISAPMNMMPFYHIYKRNVDKEFDYRIIPTQILNKEQVDYDFILSNFKDQNIQLSDEEAKVYHQTYEQIYNEFNQFQQSIGFNFQTVDVNHCPQAYGIIIQNSKDIKLAFSGDTRPCQNLIERAQNSDILIHETTFSDELQEQAITNDHSTVKEALEVAMKSNSKYLIFTHFSQRFSKSIVLKSDYSQDVTDYLLKNSLYSTVDQLGVYMKEIQDLINIQKEIFF